MLVLAREARGLTQSELVANLSSLSQATYSRLEKGIIQINDEQLNEIANELDFPTVFFTKKPAVVTQTEYFYRKKASLQKKEQYKLEANFSLLRLWLNEMLSDVDIPAYKIPEIEVEYKNTPEVIAGITRRYLGIQKGPISTLINTLEKHGLLVYLLYNVPDKFDGTTIITEGGTKALIINGSMPNYRIRFTIAHELAHIVCHIPFTNNDPFHIVRDIENEANRFASEFLMPGEECKDDLFKLSYGKLTDLKNYWNVSKSAIIRRAFDLGCISKDRYTHLMIELSRYGERKAERHDVALDEPKIFKKIVQSYYDDLGYTPDELMRSLSIGKEDFNTYILNRRNIVKLRVAV